MAARVLKETKPISGLEIQSGGGADVEFARCYCCGMTEECTQAYIARVRERYQGRWICGLCIEAVKYEAVRSQRVISMDEAMRRHVKVCEQFKSSSPPINPGEDLISAMKQVLRRTLDSPRAKQDFAAFRPLGRSKSCFATIPEARRE